MLSPSKRMSPSMRTLSIRSFRRLKQRSSVDLPQPDGPMNAVTMFLGMSSEISCSEREAPYHSESCITWIIGLGMLGGGVDVRSPLGACARDATGRLLVSMLSFVSTILMARPRQTTLAA